MNENPSTLAPQPEFVVWRKLISAGIKAALAHQRYWGLIALYGVCLGILNWVFDLASPPEEESVVSIKIEILRRTIEYPVAFLYNAFWLNIVFNNPIKCNASEFFQLASKILKPYVLSGLVTMGCVGMYVIVAVLMLFGSGVRGQADFLQFFPLVTILSIFVLFIAIWSRFSFSFIAVMEGDSGSLKTAWRRSRNHWWDMTIAIMFYGVGVIALIVGIRLGLKLHIDKIVTYTLLGCIEGVKTVILAGILVTAYRIAKKEASNTSANLASS